MPNDDYSKILRENLRSIRRRKKLSTIDVAKILGVSQAKISYIENGKGVLSARDVAVLARRLDVPITEFFRGLDQIGETSGKKDLVQQLVHYGAVRLAKPAGVLLSPPPFEETFSQALGFIDDDRLHLGFCAALIIQTTRHELHLDRIFALTGNNPFLVKRIAEEAYLCLHLVEWLEHEGIALGARAARQLDKLLRSAVNLLGKRPELTPPFPEVVEELGQFVQECLDAKK